MKLKELLLEEIKYKIENIGYHHGQSDNKLYAYNDNELIGYIDFVKFENNIYIQYVYVKEKFRRNKYGTKLVKKLESMYDNVIWTNKTEKGQELYKSMKYKENKKTKWYTILSDLFYAIYNNDFSDFSNKKHTSTGVNNNIVVISKDNLNSIDKVIVDTTNFDNMDWEQWENFVKKELKKQNIKYEII